MYIKINNTLQGMDVTICKENEIWKKSSQKALQALKLFLIILRENL